MARTEYEVFEPVEDEYYDAACLAAYTIMFNKRGEQRDNIPSSSEFMYRLDGDSRPGLVRDSACVLKGA